MVKLAVNLRGIDTSNEGDAFGPLSISSSRELIVNKFRIYNR